MTPNLERALKRKYTPEILVPMFLKAAELRNAMNAANFPDNGGAIHSAERIIDILGLCLNYPELTHRNGLKKLERAERSVDADRARKNGEPVHIEHVYPLRAFTQDAIAALKADEDGAEDRLLKFVRQNFRLVLLTATERAHLDTINRSQLHPNRLEQAGIKLVAN